MPLATENKPCEGCGFKHTILLREIEVNINFLDLKYYSSDEIREAKYKMLCKVCAESVDNKLWQQFLETSTVQMRWCVNHTLVETSKMFNYYYNGSHLK